jgi:predicted porin
MDFMVFDLPHPSYRHITLEERMKRFKRLMKFVVTVSFLALTISEALANAGPVAPSSSDDLVARVKKLEERAVMSDTKKIVLSGLVNRAALWLDNGHKSNLAHVDNANWDSRFNITGKANYNEGLVFGGVFEIGLRPNTGFDNDVHHAQSNQKSESEIHVRVAEVVIESERFGNLSAGRGDMASYYTISDTDLSGTEIVARGADVGRLAPGARFHKNKGHGHSKLFVDREIGDKESGVFGDLDGLGRHDRIRYDTPKFYGFKLSTSHGYQHKGDLFDVAGRFGGKFIGIKVLADLAYAHDNSYREFAYNQVTGSVGILFPISMSHKSNTGINLFFAAAHRDWKAKHQANGKFYHGKVGYVDQYFSFGNTAIAVDYAHVKNMQRATADDSEELDPAIHVSGNSWGVFLVQKVDMLGTQLYAGYRRYTAKKSRPSTQNFNRIQAVMVGAAVKL